MLRRDEERAQAYLPSDEDVSFYDRHGYWVAPVILPDAVLTSAERGMTRFYSEDVDEYLALDSAPPTSRALGSRPYSHWGWRPEAGNVMRKNDYTTLRVRELAELARYPIIAACAARLSGAASLRLWHDQLLYKPTGTARDAGNVAWHTDRYYWQTCSSEDMLTAWIPFADVSGLDGAMSMVDGSHRWTDQLHIKWESAPFSVINTVLTEREATLVPIELRRGQVSFHHCKTLHGSGPNLGASPRRSLVVHFQPWNNEYVERGHYHPNDDLVVKTGSGSPDYGDPRICPTLFPVEHMATEGGGRRP
jgi:ectoine hydroxylase-related dioxygenase (phytanoyl-CoA dioxygenase family)